ncbi:MULTISPECIES: TRAP transporter small permease subunit [Halomonadaceae]|uniref:TRAP transporter small permease protein n=1 Tax=Onishia taeanensis TaxID=284577 RepID=A0A328XN48_9GAMM|nr:MULTISPECIES: TRAP transporter small permease [Halomonas]RAR59788.1 TRAP-type C4-dicarboxylate transport system permease small subunit [Halomonas taeanensis]
MEHFSRRELSTPVKIIGIYTHVMDRLSRAMAYLAAAMLMAGVLAICHMIFVRTILGMSSTWQTEFTIYIVSGAMLMGSSYVLMTGGHVAVTLLPDMIGGLPRKIMRLVSSLVGIGFCAALAYAAWLYVAEAYHQQWTTGSVWNPLLWPALVPMALGSTLLTLQYVAETLRKEP